MAAIRQRFLRKHRQRLRRIGQGPPRTLNVKAVKFVPAEGGGKNGPAFRVLAGANGFGAAWKAMSIFGKGNDCLSVKLDDPSFRAPIGSIRAWSKWMAMIWR